MWSASSVTEVPCSRTTQETRCRDDHGCALGDEAQAPFPDLETAAAQRQESMPILVAGFSTVEFEAARGAVMAALPGEGHNGS
jgi:hypothetical protein